MFVFVKDYCLFWISNMKIIAGVTGKVELQNFKQIEKFFSKLMMFNNIALIRALCRIPF